MVTEVTMYKASDDSLWPTEEEAYNHEEDEKIIGEVTAFIYNEGIGNSYYSDREIAIMICNKFKMEAK